MLSRDSKISTTIVNKVSPRKTKPPENSVNQEFEKKEVRSEEEIKWRRLYKRSAYRKRRAQFMTMHPLCAVCGEPATDLDHIVPHKGNLKLFWDVNNWQSLCHRCHSKKTMKEVNNTIAERRRRREKDKDS